jgi:hypothetical protein
MILIDKLLRIIIIWSFGSPIIAWAMSRSVTEAPVWTIQVYKEISKLE